MTDQEFQDRLEELLRETQCTPSVGLTLLEKANLLQETMDHLRLSIKYLQFDLEATRRENAALRQLLEQSDPD